MIIAKDFLLKVIQPTLVAIQLNSFAAQQILLGTAAQESGFKSEVQDGGGPGLGPFQMEPATHHDCWVNFLNYRPTLALRINSLLTDYERDNVGMVAQLLLSNPQYACAMARIKYFRDAAAIPSDIIGQANFYKRVYNGPGKATALEYLNNWRDFGCDAAFEVQDGTS